MAAYGEHLNRGGWNEERIALVKKWWAEGWTATQIANELGGKFSRNAVISKLHRMGCQQRSVVSRSITSKVKPRPSSKPRMIAQSSTPKPPRPTAKFQPPADLIGVEELVIPAHERKSLADLEACHCRWPIGDPRHTSFHFCGKKRLRSDVPYCEFHCSKAFSARTGPSKPVIDLGWNHRHVQIVQDSKVA